MTSRPFTSARNQLHVVEVGHMIGGPWAATLLGDFGAEVIKVEKPGQGDMQRAMKGGPAGLSHRWQVDGRNKRSVTLDLGNDASKPLFTKLLEWADVLVENHRPGVMQRFGFGWEQAHAINPRLVYVSVSGYGQTGPYAGRIAYDFSACALAGLTYVTGFRDQPPVLPGYAVADYMTGAFAAIGALEALRRRDGPGGTGEGEWVDLALYEPVLRISANLIPTYLDEGVQLEREGSIPQVGVPANSPHVFAYETSDHKYLSICAVSEQEYRGLAHAIEAPQLLDAELVKIESRWTHAATLDAVLRPWVARHTAEEALRILRAAKVACDPINDAAGIVADPQIAARGQPRHDGQRPRRRGHDARGGAAVRQPPRRGALAR